MASTQTLRFLRSAASATAPGEANGVDLQQEIKLFANAREREKYENMADLFAILVTTEYVEKAYIRDVITADEYAPACTKLIAQFKTSQSLNHDAVPSIPVFMEQYRMSCPAAANRLLQIGVPATIEHSVKRSSEPVNNAKHVAETVQICITLMDALKLNMAAVDQIHPLLSDLLEAIGRVSSIPQDFVGKEKVKSWLVTLNKMKASDELDQDQVRQLLFDLESAHNAFYRLISQS